MMNESAPNEPRRSTTERADADAVMADLSTPVSTSLSSSSSSAVVVGLSDSNGSCRSPALEVNPRAYRVEPIRAPMPSQSRKRAASLIMKDDIIEAGPMSQPSIARMEPRSGDSTTQICLCPPDLKIPRPRNGTFVDGKWDFFQSRPRSWTDLAFVDRSP